MPLALPSLERAHVDLLLSGHRHVRHTHLLPVREAAAPRSLLVLLAGTACSRRHRGEANSYNLVTGGRESLTVTVREWTGERFVAGVTRGYLRREGRWEEESPPPPRDASRVRMCDVRCPASLGLQQLPRDVYLPPRAGDA